MPILGPFSSALFSVLFLPYIVFIKCLSRPVLLKCFTVGVILLFVLVDSPSLPLSCLFIPNPPSPSLPFPPLPFPSHLPPHLPCCPISLISRPALANHAVSKPGGGVKKVTGVGGTTYEISVWAANLLRGVLRGVFDTPWSLDQYYLSKLVNMNNHRPLKQNGYSPLQHTKHRAVWYSLLAWPSDLNYGTMAFGNCIMAGYRHVYQIWLTALLLGTLAHRIDHCLIPKTRWPSFIGFTWRMEDC